MVASGEDLRGESSEGREDAQSGAQSFPIVCRRNWGDSILVAVGKSNDNTMTFITTEQWLAG